MDDVLHCPICGNKLRTSHLKHKLLYPVGKTANYAERVCSEGYNHIITLWTDKATKKVDLVKLSLNPKFSRFVEVDFVNQKCRITCAKEGKYEYIKIPKMLPLDWPLLEELKSRVSLYVVFS